MTETLQVLHRYADGRIKALHQWRTGSQVLVFKSQEAYDKALAHIAAGGMIA